MVIELVKNVRTSNYTIILLNNFTRNKHKKEMATKIKNGHSENVHFSFVQDSF